MRDQKFLSLLPKEAQMEREAFLEKSRETCQFCSIITDPISPRKEDVAIETPHFLTIIDIAPPTPFFFVTFPKEHSLAYYELDPAIEREFNHISEMLVEKTGSDNILFFENGAGNRGGENGYGIVSNQSVYHCHVNMIFLPEGESVIDKIIDRFNDLDVPHVDVRPTAFFPTHDIRGVTEGKPYFYVRQKNRAIVAMERGEKVVPSQFVRRATTEVLWRETDNPFWDWKNVPDDAKHFISEYKARMRRLF